MSACADDTFTRLGSDRAGESGELGSRQVGLHRDSGNPCDRGRLCRRGGPEDTTVQLPLFTILTEFHFHSRGVHLLKASTCLPVKGINNISVLNKVRADAYLTFSEPDTIPNMSTHLNIIIIIPTLQTRKLKPREIIYNACKRLNQASKSSSLGESTACCVRSPSSSFRWHFTRDFCDSPIIRC